jgi:hypothetical protein
MAILAADLTATPGKWARVGTYGTGDSARTTASLIRTGKLAAFRPAGAFEAESRSIRGTHTVWARYVGTGTQPEPAAVTVTAAHVETALRGWLAMFEYDLHKGLECGEEDGADHYPEEAADLFERLRAAAGGEQA